MAQLSANTTLGGIQAATLADIQNATTSYVIATGTGNAYEGIYDPPVTKLIPGLTLKFKAHHANTGPVTFNPNGLGAVPVKKQGSSLDLIANDILNNQIVTIVYDGAYFQMISGAQSEGGGAKKLVNQAAHGFTVGTALRWNAATSTYVKAKADSISNAEVIGLVSNVLSTSTFELIATGYVSGLSGLIPGSVYFLSDIEAGALSLIEPSVVGHVSKPLLVAISVTEGYFFNYRGTEISGDTGDVHVSTVEGLFDAVSLAGSKRIVVGPGNYTLTDDLVIPSDKELVMTIGAVIDTADYILTINGSFEAGLYQVFNCIGTGVVVFSNPPEGWAEWWGFSTSASGAHNAAYLNKAIRALSRVKMGSGTFPMAVDIVEWPIRGGANILQGQGKYANGYCTILDFSASSTGTCITAGPITVSNWTESQGIIELKDFQIRGGAINYMSDQIGLLINGISHSHIHDIIIFHTGYAMVVRGWENKIDDIGIFNIANTPSRIGVWLQWPAFDNIFTRVNIYHEIFGVLAGAINTSPFNVSITDETNYTNGNTFMQPNFGGIKAYDTGNGLVGGVCFQFNNGTYRPSVLYGWAEEIWGPDGTGGGGIYIQLGNIKDGSQTVHTPIIKGNYVSGDTPGTNGIFCKVLRCRGGEISSNYIIQDINTFFDLNDVGEWYQTAIFGNYIQSGDLWNRGSYASAPEIARVPSEGTGQIVGNVKVTGSLQATTGLSVGTGGSENIMGFYTGNVPGGATKDFAIPINCGGLMIVIEDLVNDYALAMFNNDNGTLVATEIMDAENHLSVSGNNMRLTNTSVGVVRFSVIFIGRNVSSITMS